MPVTIRPLAERDIPAVVDLSLRAWAPVFDSFRRVLGEGIYRNLYPDWSAMQAAAVERVCRDEAMPTWVADHEGRAVGFVAVVHDRQEDEPDSSEIEMIAVDPDHQRRGIAADLIAFAEDRMREHGSRLAVIGTGGDPGHAPARAAYEQAGFTPLPLVRYYKKL
ncbi:GNAT family N-acetyltransferase [Blastococcus goldschmidtiae]|uniref:GNAT family N-acetyltransferase n=1 Tax=Blastococcus goldschmidtiae TaxID=3075546 RepID=UPI00288B966C|nr:GNAT family N-acetyltransferase [Blastococcus sp. DSM 46792]